MATAAQEVSFEQKLDQLARIAVEVGLGLQRGQELLMTASLEAVPLARRITEHAYRAGASLVTTLYSDDEATLMHFRHAPDESFDRAAGWLYDGMGAAFRGGAARLAITGGNPLLLSNEDSGQGGPRQCRILQGVPAGAGADYAPRHQLDHRGRRHPGVGAGHVPRDEPAVALEKLWEAIFRTTRVAETIRWPHGRRTMPGCSAAPPP